MNLKLLHQIGNVIFNGWKVPQYFTPSKIVLLLTGLCPKKVNIFHLVKSLQKAVMLFVVDTHVFSDPILLYLSNWSADGNYWSSDQWPNWKKRWQPYRQNFNGSERKANCYKYKARKKMEVNSNGQNVFYNCISS